MALLLRASLLWPGCLDPSYLHSHSHSQSVPWTPGPHGTAAPSLPSLRAGFPPAHGLGPSCTGQLQGCGVLNPTPSLTLRGSQSSRRIFTPTLFLLRKEFSCREAYVFVPAFAIS